MLTEQLDRELLELAAKAAGYVLWWGVTDPMVECREPEHPTKTHNLWNPLTDDGDALRLAVKLRMRLTIDDYGAAARIGDNGRWQGCEVYRYGGIERATRRAITACAAAQIGRA